MSSSSETPPDTIMVSGTEIDGGVDGRHDSDPHGALDSTAIGNSSVPKPKRLACMICRKRKLKCDGIKPSCSTCSRLGHICAYDEVRRKSGPKRGYVKALEERLKQVETMLKTQDPSATSPDANKAMPVSADAGRKQPPNQRATAAAAAGMNVTDPSIGIASSRDMDRWNFPGDSPGGAIDTGFDFGGMGLANPTNNFTWEMIGLGLEEPLPPQATIDEMHQIYFEKIHPSLPMIHRYRYLAAMNLAPNQRPPVCLRYAMWTLACSVTEKFQDLKDLFYQRARKYVESDYIRGYGEHMISVAHAQTHVLLASYEFKWMYFPRAWMSTGSAVRLCQMAGLHRLDGNGLDVKQCLPPPRDWTEREERRRTFWMAFCQDRYASIGTGWPMTIDEKDILTNLPSSDEAFDLSRPEQTQPLTEAMSPAGAGKLSAYGGIVLMACLFGRNLVHLHRPDVDDRDHDLNGEFWKRHRHMDNILLNTSLCLPSHLKLPIGLGNPNIVFTNMCIHTSTICLHQAAIFKADKNRLPASVSSESKVRCITAANEIASIMRMISHQDLSGMNPFISFCLYVAARVFVQYLKSRPDDSQTADSLRFILSAMNALKRRNPLTESFLVQLDVDLEALGLRIPKLKAAFPRSSDSPGPRQQVPHNLHMTASGESEPLGKNGQPYRPECVFLQTVDDTADAANRVDLVDPEPENPVSQTPSSTGHGSQGWTATEQTASLPSRERSNGAPYVPIHGLMPMSSSLPPYGSSDMDTVSTNDMSGTSPGGGLSNRLTPNSSTVSEHRQGLAPGGHMDGSGRNSFEASPVMPHQNLSMAGTSQSEVERSVDAFFSTQSAFSMPPGVSTGLTPDQRYSMPDTPGGPDFSVPAGWPEMSSQPGMTPGTDGVLRSLLAMGPLESMDIAWDGNT
ncbi:fungal-specific transcription factor domain-containing protein [Lasiosphaeria miniovina]|uniref:Fungal-specific transcription factor domain-containing protein n=1 Tax=Lasiosphaeria miniovina TaxID=1954250 RepID=A0AA40BFP3_9PEZI|nr:fungal-specific transcription factor domain-containing protein [Lasiosphaeria miniovina]KAK0733375.1 fungal-specific transcription factor domain-containing protein [Lasiosphaeria miniovina]